MFQSATMGTTLNALVFTIWVAYFAIPFFWLLVHPFAAFWRRRRGRTYAAFAVLLWSSFECFFWTTRPLWMRETFARIS